MSRPSSTALLSLPSEVIEAILICSCSPRTVASVAQTCRTLRTLVYASPDSHLWREFFLTTWDDPRPALEHRAVIDPRVDPAAWDWGTEFRRRVCADRWLKAWRRDVCSADDVAEDTNTGIDPEWYPTTLSALTAVLDTLMTLRPFPATPPIALTVLTPAITPYPTGNAESGMGERRERVTSAPPFPPLLIVLASGFSAIKVSRSGVRVGRMVYGPHASRALLDDGKAKLVPTPSLPPQLVRMLLASRAVSVRGLPTYVPHFAGADYWRNDVLGDLFHRIICITGFVPIPPPLPPVSVSPSTPTSNLASSASLNAKNKQDSVQGIVTQGDGEEHAKIEDDPVPDVQHMVRARELFPSASEQYVDARTLARSRVYDMRYLRGDRLWGPFHTVTRQSLNARPGIASPSIDREYKLHKGKTRNRKTESATRRGSQRLNTLAWAMGMDIELDDLDSTSDDDSDDEDWHDPTETGKAVSSSQVAGGEDTESGDDDDPDTETEPEQSLITLILGSAAASHSESGNNTTLRQRARRSNPSNSSVPSRDIKPEHLRPDYVYLASARIVVEANLKELYGSETTDNVEVTPPDIGAGLVAMFWEDEEILGTRPSSSARASSGTSSSPTTTQANPSAMSTTTTLEPAEVLSRFQNPEVARLGSACGYWSPWIERQRSQKTRIDAAAGVSVASSIGSMGTRKPRIVSQPSELDEPLQGIPIARDKGKGKQRSTDSPVTPAPDAELGDWEIGSEGEACEGWDWAGVAGIWRRCVCWMDYRELLFFNLDPSKFISLGTQEACRIIPMELRITGYTRSRLMPVYDAEHGHDNASASSSHGRRETDARYFRPPPVIHFSGTSVGSDRGSDDGRSVRGSVQLIGGGEVRWQLDTYTQESGLAGSPTPEWSSDGVEVGGIGSALGVLGMWTGAGHERADPLGPFWAWKVA